jgi:hypothetical protein
MFFKCQVGVQGIFSESVDTAVRAMNMDCPDGKEVGTTTTSSATDCSDSSSSSSSHSDNINGSAGGINKDDIPLGPVILLSFIVGIFSALLVGRVWSVMQRRQHDLDSSNHSGGNGVGGITMVNTKTSRRLGGKQHSALPTNDDDDDHHDDLSFSTSRDGEMI